MKYHSKGADVVCVISDTHFPFVDSRAWKFLQKIKDVYKPNYVVHIGDIIDAHVLSRFVREAKSMGALEELHAAQRCIEKLGKIFPAMDVCYGNHCLRHLKKANDVGIPGEYFKDFPEIVGAPKGWRFGESFERKSVLYVHGDNYTGQSATLNLIKHKMTNVVHGHTHQAGTVWFNGYWGLNVGCLVDRSAYAFNYAKFAKTDPALGVGLIVNGVPRFEPL